MSGATLNIGLSGLKSYQRALESTSHNIANSATAGFQPQQTIFQEAVKGGVVVNISQNGTSAVPLAINVSPDATNETNGTDLATELINSLQYKVGFDLSVKLIKTSDEMLGTLIDITA